MRWLAYPAREMASPMPVPMTPVDCEWAQAEVRTSTRRRILDAAMEIVRRRGLAGLSMDGVARHAGLARRTVYNHFDDRTTLSREVMLDLLLKLEEHIEIDLPPDLPLAAAVRRICAGAFSVMRATEYSDLRSILAKDGFLRAWLSQAFTRRIQRPLEFMVEHHLAARLEGVRPGLDSAKFCSGMVATLEAAAGVGRTPGADQPFTVDEVASVVLARMGVRAAACEASPLSSLSIAS